ncbi:dihydropteroate synthase [Alloscardovia macacae]|uniref:Dihydropteroate synthase n=1 Tax=Alloscardovia macacae TaxID=1160091 RepID=A0A261F7R5_9BIFI|nr:dihydropteroate synthase [Alloscardovia macacae]OZG55063.1 dihydropteroate synthase [Alloscardovia macacae]
MSRQDINATLKNRERTLVMGVLNITEDSFSDGGRYLEPEAALAHAREMVAQGADILDIGAESTRPGAVRVPEEVEKERILGAVTHLVREFPDLPLSIDTTRASVARAALEAGAHIINDVSGGKLDPELPRVVAQYPDCLYIVQHWRTWLGQDGSAQSEKTTTHYANGVVDDTYEELQSQVLAVRAAGVQPGQIIIDPGLGFSKPTIDHNVPLILNTEHLSHMGYPVLIGASRKRFVAAMIREAGQEDSEETRDMMTASLSVIAAERGAWAVRVHDVARNRLAIEVAQQVRASKNQLLDRLSDQLSQTMNIPNMSADISIDI